MAQQKFFGPPPKTPFALPGVYITPEGKVSAVGEAFRGRGVRLVGEGVEARRARELALAQEKARIEAERKAREEAVRRLEAEQRVAERREIVERRAVERVRERIREVPLIREVRGKFVELRERRPRLFEPPKEGIPLPAFATIPFEKAAKGIVFVAEKAAKPVEVLVKPLEKPAKRRFPILERKVPEETAERIIADVLKFGFFAPAMPLTIEAEAAARLPKPPTKVKFVGVEQKVAKDIIRTKVAFETSQKEMGKAVGISRIKTVPKTKVQLVETVTVGKVIKPTPVLKFPKAKVEPISERIFIAAQKAMVKPVKIVFEKATPIAKITKPMRGAFEIDVGVIAKAPRVKFPAAKITYPTERFVGAGFAVKKKDLAYLIGRTITEKGGLGVSEGIIRKISTPSPGTIKTIVGGGKVVSAKAVQDVAAVVRAAAITTPKPAIPIVVKAVIAKEVVALKPKRVPKVKPTPAVPRVEIKEIEKEIVTPKVALAPRVKERVRVRQILKPAVKPRERLKERQIIKEVSLIKEKQLQKEASRLKLRLRAGEREVSKIAFVPLIPKIPLVPPPIFPLPRAKVKRRKRIPRRKVKPIEDIAISEGFVARVAGLKPIKIKRKRVRELAEIPSRPLGIRRIPQILD